MSYIYPVGGPGMSGFFQDIMQFGGKQAQEAGSKADSYASDLYNQATGKKPSTAPFSVKGFSLDPMAKPWVGGMNITLIGTWPAAWTISIGGEKMATAPAPGGVLFKVPNFAGQFEVALKDEGGNVKWSSPAMIEPAKGAPPVIPVPTGGGAANDASVSPVMVLGGLAVLGAIGYVVVKKRRK